MPTPMFGAILIIFFVIFGLLFLNALYSSYMINRGMMRMGNAYKCEMLKVAGVLHPLFLLFLPVGLGMIVFYMSVIVLLIAFVKMKIWE